MINNDNNDNNNNNDKMIIRLMFIMTIINYHCNNVPCYYAVIDIFGEGVGGVIVHKQRLQACQTSHVTRHTSQRHTCNLLGAPYVTVCMACCTHN
jgi:hypothetical protein